MTHQRLQDGREVEVVTKALRAAADALGDRVDLYRMVGIAKTAQVGMTVPEVENMMVVLKNNAALLESLARLVDDQFKLIASYRADPMFHVKQSGGER